MLLGGIVMNNLTRFLAYLEMERGLSKNTIDSYKRDLLQFASYIKKDVTLVVPDDVSDFIVHRRQLGDSVTTTNRKLSAIKTFYKFMCNKKRMNHNPASAVEGAKKPSRVPRPIDKEDVERILNAPDNQRDKAMLYILYYTGARREEVSWIKVDDINFRRGYILLRGKGNKERIVPIHKKALNEIHKLLKEHDSEWLFPSRKTGNHISKRQVNDIVKKWAEKVGVDWVTPHKFRHSFCSHLYQSGADIKAIQDMAGHASSETTQIYTKVDNERNLMEYNKLFN